MKRWIGLAVAAWTTFSAPAVKAEKLVVVFGIDDTGSYSLRSRGITLASRLIARLEPGDVFYVRRITGKSYDDGCAVFRVEIPAVGEKPANRFDTRAYARWRKGVRRAALAKRRAISVLAGLEPVKAGKTDIIGFLVAAGERLACESCSGCRRIVLITSDMADNVRRRADVDLLGAEVIVAGFQSGADPARAGRLKRRWRKLLVEKGHASSVRFVPADIKLTLDRRR